MAKKSIIIDEKHHRELKKLVEGFGDSHGGLVEKMILYFKRTGNDPTDPKNESASQRLKKLDARLISFLKVQERDILKPLRQEAWEYHQAEMERVEQLDDSIINTSIKLNNNVKHQLRKNEKNQTQDILMELEMQRQALSSICHFLDDKDKSGLKSKLKNIFKSAD